MRRLFPRPNSAAASQVEDAALAPAAPTETASIPKTPAEPHRPAKPFPELPLCFMLSHVEPDGPVRLDGVKLALTELMGLDLDAPKLGAFAGLLNACDFPLQLLVRQHPPDLERMRRELEQAQPESLPDQTKDAARRSAVCSLNWSRARASSTGVSTPSVRRSTRKSCAACWPAPVSRSIR